MKIDEKDDILSRDGYKCCYPACNERAIFLAHRIAQTKGNIKKYGEDRIHHRYNLVSVCENPNHNDYFNIGNKPVKVFNLIYAINNLKFSSSKDVDEYLENI